MMHSRTTLAVGILLLMVTVVIESTTVRPHQNQVQEGRRSPISHGKPTNTKRVPVMTNELPVENGKIPVELKCENAELSAPNALEKLPCVLINNTNKPITAGVIYTSIKLDQGGLLSVSSSYSTFDTFLHPDFRREHQNNLFLPGQEYPQGIMPVDFNNNTLITGVVVLIDYIEFADHNSLGPNHAGSQIISSTRLGAAKYKHWLAQQYDGSGQSLNAVIALLDANQPLPQELGFQTGSEESGARMYRNFARRTYQSQGAEGLLKQLTDKPADEEK